MLNIFNLKLKNPNAGNTDNLGNEVGETKHYPPANKEWSNSIYAYNKNTTKLLPIADKVILKLIKSYFNLFSRKLEKKIKSRRLRFRLRRLSTNRILVSRAELKHTSDKIIITLYIYNRQKKYYINKIKKIIASNLLERGFPLNLFIKKWRKVLMFEAKNLKSLNSKAEMLNKQSRKIISKVLKQKQILFKTLNWKSNKFKYYENIYLKRFLIKSLEREMLSIYLRQIISFNKSKFEESYLLPLTTIISKVYNKKIDFNLVNLKYLYLNSDIFSETIVKKIRNRNNRLLRVLRASLLMFKLPPIDKLAIFNDIYNRKRNIQNLKLNHLLPYFLSVKSKVINNDPLDQLLQIVKLENYGIQKEKTPLFKRFKEVTYTVLNTIKHKSICGIRIEAAGRLTRRNTAERSVFKVRYKGNIKNVDSSHKGLSSVLLRGHAKSNVQYTLLKSYTRIGSFGIKGWVSSN